MASLVGSLRGGSFPHWEYSQSAFGAVGGRGEGGDIASAAIYCLLLSIRLVDDLLDGERHGPAADWEDGRAANVALAFQAAAGEIIESADLPAARRASCHARLARAALQTAHGQAFDLLPVQNEDDYWRIVDAKTVPLLSASLALGGEMAEAADKAVEGLGGLGRALGRVIQIHDDLADALEGDSLADWRRPRHNLALLYALTTPHAEREIFALLVAQIEQADVLAEARLIVTRCGALSYCVYRLMQLDTALRQELASLDLPGRSVLEEVLDRHVAPLAHLFQQAGVAVPDTLRRP